jgi:hypothetical protein
MINKKLFKIIFFSIFIVINVYFLALSANAANLQDAFGDNLTAVTGAAGYDTGKASPETIISTVINAVLSFLGVIFLFLIMYAGFLWMTARGNEQRLEKAKDTLTAAIIGLIIIASAYAISFFVMSKISTQTLKQTTQQQPQ